MYKIYVSRDWGSVHHSPPERNNYNYNTTPSQIRTRQKSLTMAQIGLQQEKIMDAFDDNKFRNDGTVDDFYTGDLFNKYKHSSHLNETRGEYGSTNNVLKTINILIRQIKVNKLEINKNITTHIAKMPKPPPSRSIPIRIIRLGIPDGII